MSSFERDVLSIEYTAMIVFESGTQMFYFHVFASVLHLEMEFPILVSVFSVQATWMSIAADIEFCTNL